MPEAPKESKSAAETGALAADLVEGPPPAKAEPGSAVLSFARGMGAAARAMSDGLSGMAELFRPRHPRRIKRPAENLETLLSQLQQQVTAAADNPTALGDDESFWQLVRKLYHFQRRRRLQKSPDDPVEAEAKPAAEDEAEPDEPEAAEEGAEEKKPAKKRRRTQEAKAAAPPQAAAAAEEAPSAEDADVDSLLPEESDEGAEDAAADKKKKS